MDVGHVNYYLKEIIKISCLLGNAGNSQKDKISYNELTPVKNIQSMITKPELSILIYFQFN